MAVEVIAEEIATNLEEVAEATRRINAAGLGYFGGGLIVGVIAGVLVGRRLSQEKIRAQAFAEADLEIESMRELYEAKTIAAEVKPDPNELVEELGYIQTPDRPLAAPVPITTPTPIGHVNYGNHDPEPTLDDSDMRNVTDTADIVDEPNVDEFVPIVYPAWDYAREREGRSPGHPYVIHEDEFDQSVHGYSKVEYVYYAVDDVVAGEDNQPIMVADAVVGLANLKWGYGSNDPDAVYIRNDRLELEILLHRLNRSYEQEVMNLHDADTP